jgi:hypothetical protein
MAAASRTATYTRTTSLQSCSRPRPGLLLQPRSGRCTAFSVRAHRQGFWLGRVARGGRCLSPSASDAATRRPTIWRAAHIAVHPDSGFFRVSESGSVKVADDGWMNFTTGTGKVRALEVDSRRKTSSRLSSRSPGSRWVGLLVLPSARSQLSDGQARRPTLQ